MDTLIEGVKAVVRCLFVITSVVRFVIRCVMWFVIRRVMKFVIRCVGWFVKSLFRGVEA